MSQIHQEIPFPAPPARVYRALSESADFAAFTGAPADLGSAAGDAFICFGELILGRNIELVPDNRIVQAWRVFNWPEGVYSIVRFELRPDGEGTLLVFDQDGVPDDTVPHIDAGWHHKYWTPLREYLAS